MAAAGVDIGFVASHLGLAEDGLTAMAVDPNVVTLLQAIVTKAHEFNDLAASKLRSDIELENALVGTEGRVQAFKDTADKALKDLEELRQKLATEESQRQSLQNELQTVKSRGSDADSELKILKDQVESLQASNRTNMALLESRNARDDQMSEELSKQHQKNVQLNREITTLQQSVQAAQSAANSAKYKADNLRQQLDQVSRHNEDLQNQLNIKADDNLKLRREKGARITELQRQNEDARIEIDGLKISEAQLRSQVQTWQAKADEALSRVQQQQEAFARTEESYKREIENQKRLVEMSEQLTRKHQDRVQEMEMDKERMRDNYENELRRVRLDLERERQTVGELEGRIQQLEGEVDELQARLQHEPPQSAPQTPRANGSLLGRAMSPFTTPGSIRSKTAITATQAIDELFKVKGQLAGEKRRNQQLSEELDQVLTTLEAKAPQINELQDENESLRVELTQISQFSEQNHEERDQAKRAARKAESALANVQTEAKILRTQLRDLSTQIQMLVFNMHAREKGVDELTDEERYRFNQLAKGEITEDALADMSDTHQFITQKFVVFKDIQELQEKNQELLRVTRELAEQMESDEALAAKHQAVEDQKERQRLEQELANMMDEAKSMKTTMESYKTERDMFRRLLQQKASAGELNSVLGSDFDESQRPPLASIETGGEDDEHVSSAALRQLEATFDNFRTEQDMVRRTMREQIDKLSNEKNSFQSEIVKLSSQLTLASERYEMLNANFVALQGEQVELQKRNQALSETSAKQDMRAQQVAEELVQARELLESTRNETANLRAEKSLWKDIQDRLGKDNEHLVEEKDRLSSLLASQQSLLNERDISESETRRKTQAKMDSLEAELSDTRRKLSSEMEESKKLQLRKEFEAREAQKRIDDLSSNLSQVREELVRVRSARDNLEAQVADLTANLRSAQDKVGRLQPLATPRPGAGLENGNYDDRDEEVANLTEQVAELKRELDLTKTHLENAKMQAERYRELSSANEEALRELTESQEQAQSTRQEMMDESDRKIKELEGRVQDLSSELANTNNQLSTLQDSQATVARKHEDEKNFLEEEIKRLKASSERYAESVKFHQQDLRAQAEIAAKAQQDYEQELVRHAEAAKHLQALRNEHNQLKGEVASFRAAADSAKAALAQNEDSWEERRQMLEKEISELNARREDTNTQNRLLHQQLENVTSQITALQQNRLQSDDSAVQGSTGPVTDVDGLRELNSYLRREKEILEVQHDLKVQECKRLQQQLEYAQSQLDEARLKLDQERRSRTDPNRSSMSHQDLMAKLTELNVYRESSATLRSELQRATAQVGEKTARISELEGKVQPLEAKIEGLQMEKGFLEVELKQIQEDRNRWQKRTEDILSKYGKVDAAELEQLKQNITDLEAERDALKAAEEPLQAKIAELEAAVEAEKNARTDLKNKLAVQFKEQMAKVKATRAEVMQRRDELQAELQAANEQLSVRTAELAAAGQQRAEFEKQVLDFQRQVQTLRDEAAQLKQQTVQVAAASAATPPVAPPIATPASAAPTTATPVAEPAISTAAVAELEQKLAHVQEELSTANAQKSTAEAELNTVRSQLQTAIAERDQALASLQAHETNGVENAAESEGEVVTSRLSDAERKELEEKLEAAEAKAAELEEQARVVESQIESRLEATLKQRSDKMRDSLNAKLRGAREEMGAEIEQLKKDKEELRLKLEQEKVIKAAEGTPAATAATTTATATPAAATPATAQLPATPMARQQPADATPSTPTTGTPLMDLAHLGDADLRKLLSSHPTAKSIITSNLKKKLEIETTKLEQTFKSEWETKVAQARQEAQMMEQKRATVKVNMTENRAKIAQAKLGVVEKAATETPQRPVGEVWEEAKVAKPAPAPVPGLTRSSSAATPSSPVVGSHMGSPAPGMAPPAVEEPKPMQRVGSGIPKPGGVSPSTPSAAPSSSGQVIANPFAPPPTTETAPAPNPFAAGQIQPVQSQLPKPPPPQQQQYQQQQQQQQQQQGRPHSGLPMPSTRGGRGGRGGGGAYVPPGRNASGNVERGGGAHRGGRGGHRGAMNPGATDFQPGVGAGTKRPRGDSEIGGGAKRARGGH